MSPLSIQPFLLNNPSEPSLPKAARGDLMNRRLFKILVLISFFDFLINDTGKPDLPSLIENANPASVDA